MYEIPRHASSHAQRSLLKRVKDFLQGHSSLFRRYSLALLLLPVLASSATAAQDRENVIWQSGLDYVALLTVTDEPLANDHPIAFSQREIFELLASVQLKDADNAIFDLDFMNIFSRDEKDLPDSLLFNRSELSSLSKPVASALASATPNQDVVFRISGRHEKTLGKSNLTTTGRLFFSQGQLNLIIGELRVDIEKKYLMRGGYSDHAERVDYHKLKNFRLDTGSRTSDSNLDYTFVTDSSHHLKAFRGEKRQDWLLIDVATLRDEINAHKEKAQRKENIVDETVDLKQQTQQIDQDQEQLKKKVDRLERLLEARERSAQTARQPVTSRAPSAKSVEQRLTELKSLYDKGMISEDIYKQKMSDILKDL